MVRMVVAMEGMITNKASDEIIDVNSGQVWTPPDIAHLCDVWSRNDNGYVSLYNCSRCASVVDDEQIHIDYHRGLQNMKNALTLTVNGVQELIKEINKTNG